MSLTDLLTPRETCSEYVCPICKKVVPKIEVELFGKKKMVQPACKCEAEQLDRMMEEQEQKARARTIERTFTLESMGERFKESDFDNFIVREGTRDTFDRCKQYAEDFKNENLWLLICGNPGNGKTHLATAIGNYLHKQGYTIVFQLMPQLLGRIRSTFNSDKEREADIMRALTKCDLLILDDLGSEKSSEWVMEVVMNILDGRYRDNKKTVITSNFTPKQLEQRMKDIEPIQGSRIYDRIKGESIILYNTATSFRDEQARKRYFGE